MCVCRERGKRERERETAIPKFTQSIFEKLFLFKNKMALNLNSLNLNEGAGGGRALAGSLASYDALRRVVTCCDAATAGPLARVRIVTCCDVL